MKKANIKTKVKKIIESKVSDPEKKMIDDAINYASKLDYKLIAKNVLKIAIPLVVLKMIHKKYKNSQKGSLEKTILPLFEELKSKIKNL